MIFNNGEYIRTLLTQLHAKPTKVWISSFNLHVGVSRVGAVYQNSVVHQMLSKINKETTGSRIMIGHSVESAEKYAPRMVNCAEYFEKIDWRVKLNSHLKCWVFFYDHRPTFGVAGGRNLGDSTWDDLSLVLTEGQTRKLVAHYDSMWSKAKPVRVGPRLIIRDGKDGR